MTKDEPSSGTPLASWLTQEQIRALYDKTRPEEPESEDGDPA